MIRYSLMQMIEQLGEIALKVSDGGIDLSQIESHFFANLVLLLGGVLAI